jgi:hypothetical protein
MGAYADRLRRLREARATGRVPADLIGWLIDLATEVDPFSPHTDVPPDERLLLAVSSEVDRWMTRRGVTGRTISAPRRSVARCLKGENVSLRTLADVADSLGCDVRLEFVARDISGTTRGGSGTTPFPEASREPHSRVTQHRTRF